MSEDGWIRFSLVVYGVWPQAPPPSIDNPPAINRERSDLTCCTDRFLELLRLRACQKHPLLVRDMFVVCWLVF